MLQMYKTIIHSYQTLLIHDRCYWNFVSSLPSLWGRQKNCHSNCGDLNIQFSGQFPYYNIHFMERLENNKSEYNQPDMSTALRIDQL